MPSTGYIGMSSSGCLLPLLIIFNLFFGRLIFNSTGLWLSMEAVLILIFALKIKFMVSRIIQQFQRQGPGLAPASRSQRQNAKIVDVQGQEVQDENGT